MEIAVANKKRVKRFQNKQTKIKWNILISEEINLGLTQKSIPPKKTKKHPHSQVFPRLNVVFDLVTKIQIKMFVKLKYRTLNQKQHLYPFRNSK